MSPVIVRELADKRYSGASFGHMNAQRPHADSNATVTPMDTTIGDIGGAITINLRNRTTEDAVTAVAKTINKVAAFLSRTPRTLRETVTDITYGNQAINVKSIDLISVPWGWISKYGVNVPGRIQ